MAGSRLEAFGTIFTRTRGLLVSGAVKEHDRPIWFDVFAAFPPHVEPRQFRPVPTNEVRPIFYEEDRIRAKFYNSYGYQSVIDLSNHEIGYKSLSQKFIDKYMELKNSGDSQSSERELFKETETRLIADGLLAMKGDTDSKKEAKTDHTIKIRQRESDEKLIKTPINVSQFMNE
jgi:small subunit ribosomal protein S23